MYQTRAHLYGSIRTKTALNQRVLGSSPSASTIFYHKLNGLNAFSSKVGAIRFRLGSSLGSTANCGAFFPFAAAYENRVPQKAPFGIAGGRKGHRSSDRAVGRLRATWSTRLWLKFETQGFCVRRYCRRHGWRSEAGQPVSPTRRSKANTCVAHCGREDFDFRTVL